MATVGYGTPRNSHLSRTVRTGSYSSYAPDPVALITWTIV
jgi:hypothetical protein